MGVVGVGGGVVERVPQIGAPEPWLEFCGPWSARLRCSFGETVPGSNCMQASPLKLETFAVTCAARGGVMAMPLSTGLPVGSGGILAIWARVISTSCGSNLRRPA